MQNNPSSVFSLENGNTRGHAPIKSMAQAIDEARKTVQESRDPNRAVLKTRWEAVNKMLLGGFRFDNNYGIAGASGHGKSYLLNMILQDFLSQRLKEPFDILHFGFEQSASDEILRRAQKPLRMSYKDLLSSERVLASNDLERLSMLIESWKDDPLYFVDKPLTGNELYDTVKAFRRSRGERRLVITLDHALLVKEDVGEDEVKMMSNLAKLFIEMRKEFGSMGIMLLQLNDKIESEKRRDEAMPHLHYPTKTDLHGSKQIYHALDSLMVIHQPELLHLPFYGKNHFPTEKLVALHQIKSRKGEPGMTRLYNDLGNGNLLPWKEAEHNPVTESFYGFQKPN